MELGSILKKNEKQDENSSDSVHSLAFAGTFPFRRPDAHMRWSFVVRCLELFEVDQFACIRGLQVMRNKQCPYFGLANILFGSCLSAIVVPARLDCCYPAFTCSVLVYKNDWEMGNDPAVYPLFTDIWTHKPGLSISAFFYFRLGAFEAINEHNLVVKSKQLARTAVPICAILFLLCIVLHNPDMIWGAIVKRLFIIIFIPVLFSVAVCLIEKHGAKPARLLVNSCFFIYAAHTAALFVKWSPIALSNIALHKIIPGTSGLEDGLCYLLTPIVTASLCFIIYYVLLRICPKATAIFNGNRIEK